MSSICCIWCFPGGKEVKNPPANAGDTRNTGSIPGEGRSPEVGNDNPLQYFQPGKFHGQRRLVGYSTWGCKESDMTEQLSTHTICYIYIYIYMPLYQQESPIF